MLTVQKIEPISQNPKRDLELTNEKFCFRCNKLRHVSFLRYLNRNYSHCIIPCVKITTSRGVLRRCKICGRRTYTSFLIRTGFKTWVCK